MASVRDMWPLGKGIGRVGTEGMKVRWSFRVESSPSLLVGHHTDGLEPWAQGTERVQRQRGCLL